MFPITILRAFYLSHSRCSCEFMRFHFRSVATGNPHPRAEQPTITVCFDSTFIQENNLSSETILATTQIVGNCFVAKIHCPQFTCDTSELLLWDWKTGALLARIYAESYIDCFTFLDKEHLLVCSALSNDDFRSTRISLFIYRLPNVIMGYKVPPNAEFTPSLYPKHNPILVFELPELHPSWTIARGHLMLHSDPLPGDIVYSKSVTLLCSRVTTLTLGFRILCNQQNQIHQSSRESRTDFRVFINTQKIFAYIEKFRSEGTVTIPWNLWGTSSTRWFIEDAVQRLVFEIYRSHYPWSIAIQESLGGTELNLVSIVDFNAPIIKRYAYNSGTMPQTVDIAERTLILEGKGMLPGHRFQPGIGSVESSIATPGEALDHRV